MPWSAGVLFTRSGVVMEGAASARTPMLQQATANDAARTNAALTAWQLDPYPPMRDMQRSIAEDSRRDLRHPKPAHVALTP